MSRAPKKTPAKRRAPNAGPGNQSRGAGAPAPASAASTAPFYAPDGAPAESQLAAHAEHIAAVRGSAVDLGEGAGSADHSLSEHHNPAAPDLASEIARIRQMRRPLGSFSQKLAIDERRGYHRHWFNDSPGRVDEARANGWSHVPDKDGKPTKRVVGAGRDNGALFAYAMEIPEVFWLEDMAARHEIAQGKIEAIKKSPFRSAPGEAKPSDAGKFYSPQEEAGPLQVVKT